MDPSGAGAAAFQQLIQEVFSLYEQAIQLEPGSSEALAAYSQLKCKLIKYS
jgi:hypothetical protein